jgi:hypothetical protein
MEDINIIKMLEELAGVVDFSLLLSVLKDEIEEYESNPSANTLEKVCITCSIVLSKKVQELEESENPKEDKINKLPPELRNLANKIKRGEI